MTEKAKEHDGSKFCGLRNPAEGSPLLNVIKVDSSELQAEAWGPGMAWD